MGKQLSVETIYAGLYVLPRGTQRSALLATLRQARKAPALGREALTDAVRSPT